MSINLVIQLIEQLRNIISLMQYQWGFILLTKKCHTNSQLKLTLTIKEYIPSSNWMIQTFGFPARVGSATQQCHEKPSVPPSPGSVLSCICLVLWLAPDPGWLLLSSHQYRDYRQDFTFLLQTWNKNLEFHCEWTNSSQVTR